MPIKQGNSIDSIAKQVLVLNEELGKLKNDIDRIKKLVYYMAGIVSVAVGKIVLFP